MTASGVILALGLFLARTTLGRTMRALADDRALAAIAGIDVGRTIALTWILSGLLAAVAGVLAGLVQTSFDPNFGFQLLLPIFAAVVLGGIGSAYGALAGGLLLGIAMELSTWSSFLGGVDPVYKPVVAFVVLAAALMVRPQGLFGRREGRVSALASGDFWAFVGVVAGIYTILALGLQLEFGFTGLLNFGQVAFMAIGAYTMAILVVKEGWSTWLAAPLAVGAAAVAGVLLGLPSVRLRADYFAIVTIAFSEIVRYVAMNEQSLTGGSQGTIALGEVGEAAQYNGQWERLPGAGVQGVAARLLERRRDARDRLGRRRRAARARLARGAHALGPRAARDPRGRGRRCVARQERVRVQAAGARARLGARRHRRALLRVAVLVLQPRRLPAAARRSSRG